MGVLVAPETDATSYRFNKPGFTEEVVPGPWAALQVFPQWESVAAEQHRSLRVAEAHPLAKGHLRVLEAVAVVGRRWASAAAVAGRHWASVAAVAGHPCPLEAEAARLAAEGAVVVVSLPVLHPGPVVPP